MHKGLVLLVAEGSRGADCETCFLVVDSLADSEQVGWLYEYGAADIIGTMKKVEEYT